MRCEQILPLLSEYVAGELPGYKAAWVAQHLAWCKECQRATEQARLRGTQQELAVARTAKGTGRTSGEQRPVLYRKVGTARRRRRPVRRRGRRLLTGTVIVVGLTLAWYYSHGILGRYLAAVDWTQVLDIKTFLR